MDSGGRIRWHGSVDNPAQRRVVVVTGEVHAAHVPSNSCRCWRTTSRDTLMAIDVRRSDRGPGAQVGLKHR